MFMIKKKKDTFGFTINFADYLAQKRKSGV